MKQPIERHTFQGKSTIECEINYISDVWIRQRPILLRTSRANFYVGIWVCTGSLMIWLDFDRVVLNAGEMIFFKPNIVQRFEASTAFQGINLLFTERFFAIDDASKHLLFSTPLFDFLHTYRIIPVAEGSAIAAHLHLMAQEQETPYSEEQPRIMHASLQSIVLLGQRTLGLGSNSGQVTCPIQQLVRRFCILIEKYYTTCRQVSYYTRELSVTEKVLGHYCKDILGKTPKAVIDERITLEAQRLLAHTSLSAKEIGYRLGFEEPTYFAQFFKRQTGMTTAAFRLTQ